MLKITCDHYFLKRQCQLTMKAKKQKMNMKKSHSPIIYLYFLPPLLVPPLIFQKITPTPPRFNPTFCKFHSLLQKGWGHYASNPVKEKI